MNGLALCAGYGGLELAIERFFPSYTTVCYVEGEAFVAQHLVKKMEEGRLDHAPIWSNVRTFNGEPWRGKVDIISGGFPCQPYSSAGKQLAEKDPRDLWRDFVRIIGEVRPGFLFFENVPGIVKWRLEEIVLDLDKIGFDVAWGVMGASDVGAPHRRKRWFLFGVRNDTNPNHAGERIGCGTIQQKDRNDISGLCSIFSNTYGLGRDKVKSKAWGGKLDLEGISLNISNPNGQRSGESGELFERTNGQFLNRISETGEIISNPKSERSPRIERLNGKAQKIRQGEGYFDSSDKWGGGFESWWEIEPSMGRLVDGASDWVDKLRILGNGVVPQQAYSALHILGARLACGIVANREPKG